MERCDDSYGVIGELGTDALLTYASFDDYEPTAIAGEDRCEDLCELLARENRGAAAARRADRSPNSTANLPTTPSSSCSRSPTNCAPTACCYEADQTITNVAYLHIAAGRVTRFAPVAQQLGSDHWTPAPSYPT
jgi:hypothetical protein